MPNLGCLLGNAYFTLVNHLAEELSQSKLDITVPEYLILRILYTRDGMQQCDIASAICKDKATVSRSVSSLVNKGFVKTETLSHKCCQVYLTSTALNIKADIMYIAEKRHKALTEMFSDEELNTFINILNRIRKE